MLHSVTDAVLWAFGIRKKRRPPREHGEEGGGRQEEEYWDVDTVQLASAVGGALLAWWVIGKFRSSQQAMLRVNEGGTNDVAVGIRRIPLSEFFGLLRAGAITAVTYLADRPPAGSLVVNAALPAVLAGSGQLPQTAYCTDVASDVTVASLQTFKKFETLLLPGCHQALFEELRSCKSIMFECADILPETQVDAAPLSLLIDAGGLVVSIAALIYLLRNSNQSLFGNKSVEDVVPGAQDHRPAVSFDDVAGMDTTKEELREVIAFLRDPHSFYALGARPPRGVLLAGPSGTGKTLLARAVAGEAGVPFLYASSAAFVEVYVGQGAQRVRQFYEQARSCSPCIVFLDELDAIGAARQMGGSGGNQEYAQTLNQLLLELDGIESHSHGNGDVPISDQGAQESRYVVTIAATNRYDCLDDALIRPGRLDRIVLVQLPTLAERKATLQIHARKLHTENLDFDPLARRTEGQSGADLANLLNEAALLAARRGASAVRMEHVEEMLSHPRPVQRGQTNSGAFNEGPLPFDPCYRNMHGDTSGFSPELWAQMLTMMSALTGSAVPATGAQVCADLGGVD